MSEEAYQLLWSVLGAIATALISLASTAFTLWIKKKFANDKEAQLAIDLNNIVTQAVLYFTQTVVSDMKKAGTFDANAQAQVKADCIAYVKGKLTPELTAYLTEHKQDIGDLIEAKIGELK